MEMKLCSAECHALLVPAFIEFNRAPMGHFQFGAVRGWLDCRFGEVVAGGVPRELPRRTVVARMVAAWHPT